jgi:hypothetical protein
MFGCGILHQVTVRNVGASQLDVVPPLACQYAEGPSRVGGGGGALPHQNPVFSPLPPGSIVTTRALGILWLLGQKNSEIVRSTYLSPSLKFA